MRERKAMTSWGSRSSTMVIGWGWWGQVRGLKRSARSGERGAMMAWWACRATPLHVTGLADKMGQDKHNSGYFKDIKHLHEKVTSEEVEMWWGKLFSICGLLPLTGLLLLALGRHPASSSPAVIMHCIALMWILARDEIFAQTEVLPMPVHSSLPLQVGFHQRHLLPAFVDSLKLFLQVGKHFQTAWKFSQCFV